MRQLCREQFEISLESTRKKELQRYHPLSLVASAIAVAQGQFKGGPQQSGSDEPINATARPTLHRQAGGIPMLYPASPVCIGYSCRRRHRESDTFLVSRSSKRSRGPGDGDPARRTRRVRAGFKTRIHGLRIESRKTHALGRALKAERSARIVERPLGAAKNPVAGGRFSLLGTALAALTTTSTACSCPHLCWSRALAGLVENPPACPARLPMESYRGGARYVAGVLGSHPLPDS